MEGTGEGTAEGGGKYLYCVADSGESTGLGKIGLEEAEVYTIPYRDICAVGHTCGVKPYQACDGEIVKTWAIRHQKVVDAAWERWNAVLPSVFNTVIGANTGRSAGENVLRWLEEEYQSLKHKMDGVRGKAEYGVQVFWDPKVVARDIAERSAEIKKLEVEIRSQPKGLAYLYRQRLENLLHKEMETSADQCFRECYGRIRKHVDDIQVEKTKRAEPQMIMNISCLVLKEGWAELAGELENIEAREGFSVRFTGPWPPYSFCR